ncbi:hypothetical protein O181_047032 [Austropuccinia psidii MF-1]|uniref:RING-type domain-containing protein n=1 Tax=Austropuccinia psidii MF-1 TaxID=1389203 RepID=A0A9Q3DX22_9BASI|nr:hypothetical protein [Austropuccinia psidii MF-1]
MASSSSFPLSSMSPSNSPSTNGPTVLDLSDSDQEAFFEGLDEEIQQISSNPNQSNPNFIDLTNSPPPPLPLSSSSSIVISNNKKRKIDDDENVLVDTTSLSNDDQASIAIVGQSSNQAQTSISHQSSYESPKNTSETQDSEGSLDFDDDLSCPICCEFYVAPANFPCGHTFCGNCAHEWLQKEEVCPTCRQELKSTPARMYALDTMVQKYLKYQADRLRRKGKEAEGVALELDYQKRNDQWNNRKKKIEAIQHKMSSHWSALSRSQSVISNGLMQHSSHPVILPRINGLTNHQGYSSISHPHHPLLTPISPQFGTGHSNIPPLSGLLSGEPLPPPHQFSHRAPYTLFHTSHQPSSSIPTPIHSNRANAASSANQNNGRHRHSSRLGLPGRISEASGWDPTIVGFFARS